MPNEPTPHNFVRGSGSGLTIVAAIAAQRGGALDIASRAGVGTTVTLRVPLASSA